MARSVTAARRYAEAAFELASSEQALDAWGDDLRFTASRLADEQVARVLANPVVPIAERRDLIERLLGGRVRRPVEILIVLLMQRGRSELISSVAAEYDRLLDASKGVQTAIVASARPLTPEELEAVQARVRAMTGAEVRITTAVDASLIGGLTVRVGDRLLDASVRGRLERLRNQLVTGVRLPSGSR